MGILSFLLGTDEHYKQLRQQERVFRKYHAGVFFPEEDGEYYKKNAYGDKYDPNYEKKREARMKKKYGDNYIENYDQKLWKWNGEGSI